MNTKAIIASTLLTALFAGQTAIAGQDNDQGVFAENTVTTEISSDKVRFDIPTLSSEETIVSGRK